MGRHKSKSPRLHKDSHHHRTIVKRHSVHKPRIRKNHHVKPIHIHTPIHYTFAPVVRHDYRGREYCFRDYYHHRNHRSYKYFSLFGYWPKSRFSIVYRSPGLSISLGSVYPRYHRKYVFVSVGGWWPRHYRHVRYYWYGHHPYRWYGYYPEVYKIDSGDVNSNNTTNNYYTYNYYYGDDSSTTTTKTVLDSSQLAAVQQQLEDSSGEPATRTRADELFDSAVEAFEDGHYDRAANLFADAMRVADDDVILPFAYSQALFADGQYVSAAQALRTAFEKLPADKEDMFYPRGLYDEEETLNQQIETLGTKVDSRGYDTDLQLLLGYHLIGIGQLDDAVPHLEKAAGAFENKLAVDKMLKLIERIQTQQQD